MVRGIEVFRERLASFRDSFIVIGGTACDLNLQFYGGFRRTRDIDMIVVTEAVDAAFADALHAFLREGGYECYVSRDRKPHYYRFMSPKDPVFPAQIEMLSHTLLPEHPEWPFTPISLDEGIRSLSAIVLDPDYYEYAKAHRDFSWGVPCLTVEALVVFKCAAYLNLRADRERDPSSGLVRRTPCGRCETQFRSAKRIIDRDPRPALLNPRFEVNVNECKTMMQGLIPLAENGLLGVKAD